jgi:hypothetical protein
MKNSVNSSNLTACALRPKQAAEMAAVSVGTIYVWLNEDPPPFKTWVVKRRGFERGIRYIDRISFEKFLKSQREDATVV